MTDRVGFANLRLAEEAAEVREAVRRVLDSGWFVLGPEVDAFEREFAEASGVAHAVGVGNGTDAIALILRGLGIGRGDEVITTPLSAAYTALAVLMAGATPVFADIDPARLTLDPDAVRTAIGPRTAAILPVHLYGQGADMIAIAAVAQQRGLAIVEDCCQAHFATAAGQPVGTIGRAGAFSFYPTKNLGALGDGGAVVTNDGVLAERIRRLRNGGQTDRYHHLEPGVNSRLDELQAALLRAKLPFMGSWTSARRAVARFYRQELAGTIDMPPQLDSGHVYHLFPALSENRDELRDHLSGKGIDTLVHYPIPIPRQAAFSALNPGICPQADRVSRRVLSLPCHHRLVEDDLQRIAAAIRCFTPSRAADSEEPAR